MISRADEKHWGRIVNLAMFIQKRWKERFIYCSVIISLNSLMFLFLVHTIAITISPFMTALMLWI